MGAAPGGWTKVLSDLGASVVAVDPGALSSEVLNCASVTHLRHRIEYANLLDHSFDILVNDMSLDPTESAALRGTQSRIRNSGHEAYVPQSTGNHGVSCSEE